MTTTYEIERADLQEQHVAFMRGRIPLGEIPGFLATVYSRVPVTSAQQGRVPTGPPYARYRFVEDGTFEIEAGFPVSGAMKPAGDVEPGTLPGGLVLSTLHIGTYETVAAAYDALGTYLGDNGYQPAGAAWECYLDGPDVPEPRTKVYQPVRQLSSRCK